MVCYNVEQGEVYNLEEIFSTALRQACKNYEGEKTTGSVQHGVRDMFGNLAGAAKRIAGDSTILEWKIESGALSIQFQSPDPDSSTSRIREMLERVGEGKTTLFQPDIDKIMQKNAEIIASGRRSILPAEDMEFPQSTQLERYHSTRRELSMLEK